MTGKTIEFQILEAGAARSEAITIDTLVIAGWTGRDLAALEKHIKELEELGVKRPASTPIFYRVAATRLSLAPAIQCSGGNSSGEVEFVLVQHKGRLYVGVGSDHTDREVETYNVTVSKQMCEKPVAAQLWLYDDVRDHWDSLKLRSRIAGETLYQDGSVTAMRDPRELIELYAKAGLPDGTLMFCGTLAAIGGIRPSSRFSFELEDPVLGRRIGYGYDIAELPVLG